VQTSLIYIAPELAFYIDRRGNRTQPNLMMRWTQPANAFGESKHAPDFLCDVDDNTAVQHYTSHTSSRFATCAWRYGTSKQGPWPKQFRALFICLMPRIRVRRSLDCRFHLGRSRKSFSMTTYFILSDWCLGCSPTNHPTPSNMSLHHSDFTEFLRVTVGVLFKVARIFVLWNLCNIWFDHID
jgi:hypothetical protein